MRMKKFITDERTGLKYELIGDYYFIAGDDEPAEESKPIGIWGRRHLQFIKEYKKALYIELRVTDKLNSYLADINEQADDMFLRLINQLAEKEGVTEQLKAENQMLWVQKINNIHNRAREFVYTDIIYNVVL